MLAIKYLNDVIPAQAGIQETILKLLDAGSPDMRQAQSPAGQKLS